jgi:hypothetical protein
LTFVLKIKMPFKTATVIQEVDLNDFKKSDRRKEIGTENP